MIKNIYYKCKYCNNISSKYIDDKYKNSVSYICPECQKTEFIIVNSDEYNNHVKLKNNLKDYKALDKTKYFSSQYKDMKEEIKRVHIEQKGLLGDKRKFI
jgi:hypothetical protein